MGEGGSVGTENGYHRVFGNVPQEPQIKALIYMIELVLRCSIGKTSSGCWSHGLSGQPELRRDR